MAEAKKLLLVLMLCWPSVCVAAGILDVFKAAESSAPGLLEAAAGVDAARAGKAKARSGFLPTASVEGHASRVNQHVISSDNAVYALGRATYTSDQADAKLTQPLFHWDAIQRYGKAGMAVEKAELERADARSGLILQVVEAALDVLFARDDLNRALREREAMALELKRAERRRATGQASRVDIEEARARSEMVEALVVEARDALQVRMADLELIAGHSLPNLPDMTGRVDTLAIDPLESELWVKRASTGNLRVRAAELGVRMAEKEVSVQMGGHFPTLDAEASYEYLKTTGSLFGGGSTVGNTRVGVVMRVPLLAGGRVLAATDEARARLRQARARLQAARREAMRDARDAFSGVMNGLAKLAALRKTVHAQEFALNARERGRSAGLNTTVDVLDARRDLFIARRNFARARYDYVKHVLRLKRAAGMLSDQDLQTVDRLLGGNA